MRPVQPAANRQHPNYTVDPATDAPLRVALEILQHNVQEEGLFSDALDKLISRGVKLQKYDLSGYSKDHWDLLTELREDWDGNPIRDGERRWLMQFGLRPIYKKLRDKYESQVEKYKNARGDLLKTLGYYCSYCGVPVSISVHVEHKLPKRDFPQRAVQWDNLLLACNSCNQAKGDHPSREEAIAALPDSQRSALPEPLLEDPLNPTHEGNIANAARGLTIWPDDPSYTGLGVFSYRLMRVQYNDQGIRTAATPIPPDELEVMVLNGKVRRLPPWTGKVVRLAQMPPNNTDAEVELHVVPNTGADEKVQKRAQYYIDMLNLNRSKKNDLRSPSNGDLRVPLRTEAWVKAVNGVYRLIRAYVRDKGQMGEGYRDMESVILESAMTSGFWSVWVYVFSVYLHRQDELRRHILQIFTDPQYFPGTRWSL